MSMMLSLPFRRAAGGMHLSRFYSAAKQSPSTLQSSAPLQPKTHPDPASHPSPDPSTPTPTPTTTPAQNPTRSSRGDDAMALPRSLPEPSPQGATAAPSGQLPELRVGGDALKLGSLGPLVVNPDGSVGRVTNWAEMTAGEREATLRLLGRRNQERLKVLREAKEREEGGQ
ncbi:Fc.00g015410.m01.CDS01 [Cosmosporella sp. VM-42]